MATDPSARAALFDLDRTLLDCNSARLWVQEEWRTGAIGVGDMAWAIWWLGRYSLGLESGLDDVFATAVAKLEGQSEAEMGERVDRWFARDLRHRLRPGGRQALERHRARGDRLVLATSSSLYVGRAAMRAFGLDELICTRFEVVDGRFTGAITALAVGDAKADRAREWASRTEIDLTRCAFYTDSHTDLALLHAVGEPVVVNPDRRLRTYATERGWPIEDWGKSPEKQIVVGGVGEV